MVYIMLFVKLIQYKYTNTVHNILRNKFINGYSTVSKLFKQSIEFLITFKKSRYQCIETTCILEF